MSSLRELLHRQPPTAWEQFLAQPCIFLARKLYTWHQTIPAQPLTLTCLCTQPHPIKIVVAGNHDLSLDAGHDESDQAVSERAQLNWGEIIYLENEEITVCANGCQLRIYGSPLTTLNGNWADSVPDGIDVLITHGPPCGHLDSANLGCVHLLR